MTIPPCSRGGLIEAVVYVVTASVYVAFRRVRAAASLKRRRGRCSRTRGSPFRRVRAAASLKRVGVDNRRWRDYNIPPNTYDLITNLYFPQPDLIPKIKAGLKPGGFILYEQWRPVRRGQGFPGESSGAGSGGNVYQYSDLSREELLRQFPDYRIHLYREAMINHAATAGPGRGILMSEVMSLVAQKPFD